MCRAYGQRRHHVRCRSSMPSRHGWRGRATTCVRSEAPPEFGARARGSSRGELVRGCGRRVEVGVAGVAPVVCAACPLTCPRGLGWTAPRASVGIRSGASQDSAWTPAAWRRRTRLWGSVARSSPVLGLAPAAGARRTPRRADWTPVCGVWMTAGLSRRSPPRRSRGSPSPAQPPRRFAWACGRGYPRLTGC